jgi:tetratricopeptide (TPR) repeat protein
MAPNRATLPMAGPIDRKAQILRYDAGVPTPRLTLIGLLLVAASGTASAAPPWEARFMEAPAKEVLEAAKHLPPADGAGVQVLLEERVSTIGADGHDRWRFRRAYRVLKKGAIESWSETRAFWEPWHQTKPVIRARVITPDGRVHVLDPKTIELAAAEGTDPDVYSDEQSLRAPLPAVVVGAVVEEEISQDEGPIMAGAGVSERWWVGAGVPLLRSRLIIDLPKGMALHVVRRPDSIPAPTRTESGDRARLVFEAGPLGEVPDPEEDAPRDVPPGPYIEFSTDTNWADVAARYTAAVDKQLADAQLGDVVKGVDMKGARTAEERIGRLVARMHRDVRYTGVEFGDASIVPRRPAEVLERRYGDCKDKAAFLVALLRAAKVRAHVALLRATGGDVDPELPSMARFNHAIVYVPAAQGVRALWIDPTDPYSPVGELPLPDQGRLALIADARTTALTETPRSSTAANHVFEMREVRMSEEEGAHVSERSEYSGSIGRYYRDDYADVDRKKIEDMLTRYVKASYRAKKLERFEYGDSADPTRPFVLKLEAANAEIESVSGDGARVFLSTSALFDRLPAVLRGGGDAKEEGEDGEGGEGTKGDKEGTRHRRKADYVFAEPYSYEIRYRVVPPHGFVAESPPADETHAVGSAKLAYSFSLDKSGAVLASLRFDTGKPRLSPSELEALRDGLEKIFDSDAPVVAFRQVGEASLQAGRVREALAEFRKLDAAHPGQALHTSQIALALLRAGLGDEARRQARRCVEVAPKSALCQRTLGWILEHDGLGRRFKAGWDPAGAQAAYRKALAIDPDDQTARASLAIILEYDAAGERSYPRATLDEAIGLYAQLKDETGREYLINRLIALLYRERFAEVETLARGKKLTENEHAMVLTAVAVQRGVPAALKEASIRLPGAEARAKTLQVTASMLLNLRRYPDASALYGELAHSVENGPALRALIDQLARTKRRESLKLDRKTPEGAFRLMMAAMMSVSTSDPTAMGRAVAAVATPELAKSFEGDKASQAFWRGMRAGAMARARELPVSVIADLAVAADLVVEGDAVAGYRVRVLADRSPLDHALYLVITPDGLRVGGFAPVGPLAGEQALKLAAAGQLAAARRWLDWAVQGEHLGTADDPLSGSILARLWSRGVAGDRARIERAAWVLTALGPSPKAALPALERCRKEGGDGERLACLEASIAAAVTLKKQVDELALTQALVEQVPGSFMAQIDRIFALRRAERWPEVRALAQKTIERFPEQAEGLYGAVEDAMVRAGDWAGAMALARKSAQTSRNRTHDLNQLAWMALIRGDTGKTTLEDARRAVESSGREGLAALHTLASVLAERDSPEEALEILLELLDKRGDDTPEEADWYVIGRVAEAYGATEMARDAYARVKPPTTPEPLAVWVLADRRMRRLPPRLAR